MKYAVCINDQGIYSPTIVADFVFQPKEKLHVWKGKFATSASELCEQVNEALDGLKSFADPFLSLRVVEIEKEQFVNPYMPDRTVGSCTHDKFTTFAGLPEEQQGFAGQPFDKQPSSGRLKPTRKKRRIENSDLKGAFS